MRDERMRFEMRDDVESAWSVMMDRGGENVKCKSRPRKVEARSHDLQYHVISNFLAITIRCFQPPAASMNNRWDYNLMLDCYIENFDESTLSFHDEAEFPLEKAICCICHSHNHSHTSSPLPSLSYSRSRIVGFFLFLFR